MSHLFLVLVRRMKVKQNVLVQNQHHLTECMTVHQILLLCSSTTCTDGTMKIEDGNSKVMLSLNNSHSKISTCNTNNYGKNSYIQFTLADNVQYLFIFSSARKHFTEVFHAPSCPSIPRNTTSASHVQIHFFCRKNLNMIIRTSYGK